MNSEKKVTGAPTERRRTSKRVSLNVHLHLRDNRPNPTADLELQGRIGERLRGGACARGRKRAQQLGFSSLRKDKIEVCLSELRVSVMQFFGVSLPHPGLADDRESRPPGRSRIRVRSSKSRATV